MPVRAIRLLMARALLAGPLVFASPTAAGVPGKPVAAGETLQLTAVYSSSHRWDDVMGIMVGMLAPGP
jgi:hypothetical protein